MKEVKSFENNTTIFIYLHSSCSTTLTITANCQNNSKCFEDL